MATSYTAFHQPLTVHYFDDGLRSCDSFVPQSQMVARGAWEPFWPFRIGIEPRGGGLPGEAISLEPFVRKEGSPIFWANYELSAFSEGGSGFSSLGPSQPAIASYRLQ